MHIVTTLLLLQLRHPNVLAYKDSAEVQERNTTVVYLVTEAAQPLINILEELDLPPAHKCVPVECTCVYSSHLILDLWYDAMHVAGLRF